MLSATATRPAARLTSAHLAEARGPFSPFTDKLFRTGLGRLPTATERRDVEGLAGKLAARGKHIYEIGAYLSHLMTQRPDFRARHPHAATFERIYQHDLGRPPNLDEYNKLTAAVKKAGVAPGPLITFLVRSTAEYKHRVAVGAAYVAALQNGGLHAGGGWGGSQRVADKAKSIAASMGIPITSEKRDLATTIRVGSSTGSDHYTGNTNAYAVDFGVSGARGDQLAQALARAYGIPLSNLGTFNRHTITVDGQRFSVQLLWRVSGHFDHVHIGIRRA